jgi:hypothetical protein
MDLHPLCQGSSQSSSSKRGTSSCISRPCQGRIPTWPRDPKPAHSDDVRQLPHAASSREGQASAESEPWVSTPSTPAVLPDCFPGDFEACRAALQTSCRARSPASERAARSGTSPCLRHAPAAHPAAAPPGHRRTATLESATDFSPVRPSEAREPGAAAVSYRGAPTASADSTLCKHDHRRQP